MKHFKLPRILGIVCICSLTSLLAHAGGGLSTSRGTQLKTADQLERMGMGSEAENIRQNNPSGYFTLEGGVLKYVFIIMKMVVAVQVQGIVP